MDLLVLIDISRAFDQITLAEMDHAEAWSYPSPKVRG